MARELKPKETALAETAALVGAIKKVRNQLGGRRKLISSEKRQIAIQSIATAVRQGARQELTWEIIGISAGSLQHWRIIRLEDPRQRVKKEPANSFYEKGREHVLAVCNNKESQVSELP